jgi:hypothetical protein
MRLFLGSTLSQGRKIFRDTFNRIDTVTGLGTSSDGSLWNIIRGSFKILNNTAVGIDANYPMVTQNLTTNNNEIDLLGTTQGSAASIWVTDSGNWWAIGMTQEPESCNCTYYYNTTYGYGPGTCTAQNAGNYNAVTCNGSTTNTVCNANGLLCSGTWNAGTCNNYSYNSTNKTSKCSGSYNGTCNQYYTYCNSYSYAFTCTQYSASTLNAGNYYTYACTVMYYFDHGPYSSCQTCYPQYIRILQSVGNTVSTITQWSIGTIASALKIKTSGSQITISAYSDASMVSQIGSDLIYTPTGVAITPVFGITVIPSSYNQGYATDEVKITRS